MEEDDDDSGDKTEEPSQHRLEEFREKGKVALSRELSAVLAMAGTMLALILSSAYMYELLSSFFVWAYDQKPEFIFSSEGLKIFTAKTMLVFLKSIVPVCIAGMAIGVFANVSQIGFIFAPDVLSLKWERINPLEGLKRLFSTKALFDTVKSLFKFIVIIVISYTILKKQFLSFNGFFHVPFVESFLIGEEMLIHLGYSLILGLAIIAIADFAWEKWQYRQKLLLTKQQSKEELKEKEGNPEIKQRIRSIQREMAMKRMMADVPKADVIITNPTHLSVALKYEKDSMVAPKVIAKGADEVAMKIREIAREYEIPIIENVQVARSLYKTVKVGQEVPHSLYRAVAEIIGFVYRMKNKRFYADA